MTILFDIIPATGHYNSSFDLANKLHAIGNRVVYCGRKEFKQIINSKGFEYYEVDIPLIYADNIEFETKGIFFYIECFLSLFTHEREDILYDRVLRFETVIKEISPDFVILDAQLAFNVIIYHHLNIPFIYFEIMPLSLHDPWIPPFNRSYIPEKNVFSLLRIFLSWQKIVFIRKLRYALIALLLFRQDHFSLYRKLAKKFHFPFNEKLDIKRPFILGFKDTNILSMTRACFDFPRKYKPKCYYADSRIDLTRDKIITNKRYLHIVEKIEYSVHEKSNSKLIYCSLGTVTYEFAKRMDIFYREIRKVCISNPQHNYVISVGMHFDVKYLLPLPSNMYVFQRVPQLDILSRCDIMITHGGMNTIEECIKMEVPMLVFPLSKQWDQPGNSARVVYHGLGLQADILKDRSCQIEKKIDIIIERYSIFKKNLSIMNKKMFTENIFTYPSWLNTF